MDEFFWEGIGDFGRKKRFVIKLVAVTFSIIVIINVTYNLIFEEPSPGPIKAILNESFQYVGSCKLPLINASPELLDKLIHEYKRIKKLKL